MFLFRYLITLLCLFVLGVACDSDTGGPKGGKPEPKTGRAGESRLSIGQSEGEEDPVITVSGPFAQGDVVGLFTEEACQGEAVGNLTVTPGPSGAIGETVDVTHSGGDVGEYLYSVSVTKGVEKLCLDGTVQYSKLPGVPTSIAAARVLGFDASVDVTVLGALPGGNVVLYSDANCSSEVTRSDGVAGSSVSINVTSLGEGVHRLYGVIEKNNVSSVCSAVYGSYDRRASVSFDFNPSLASVSSRTTFSVRSRGGIALDDNVTFYKDSSCSGSAVGTAEAVAAGEVTASIDLSTEADGLQQLYVQIANGTGDQLPCMDSSLSYSLDREIGAISSLRLITKSPSSESLPSFRVSISGGIAVGDTINLYQDSTCGGAVSASVNVLALLEDFLLQLSSSLPLNGSYPFSAQMTDAAGNESSCVQLASSYQYDDALIALPGIVLETPSSFPGTVSTPSFRVTGVASGDTVKVYKGSGCADKVGEATAQGNSVTVIIDSIANDGRYLFYATKTPASSSTESDCSNTPAAYELDATVPVTPGVVLVGTSPGNNPTPVVTVSQAVQAETAEVYTDAACTTSVGRGIVPANRTSVNITTSHLADGTYTFYAKVSDRAGNESSCTAATGTYQLDTVSPATPTIALVTTTPNTVKTPVIKVSGVVEGDIAKLYKAADCLGEVASETVPTGETSIDLTSSALNDGGIYTFSAKAFDAVANGSSCSTGVQYLLESHRGFLPKMSAGDTHTCALSSGGGVYCWGKGDKGQIGNGARSSASHPTEVILEESSSNPLTGIVQVSSGGDYSCALTSGGEVRCWGYNNRGALGNKATKTSGGYNVVTGEKYESAPVKVVADSAGASYLSGIVQISSGWEHTCALTSAGQVKCWGSDCAVGQLGQGGYCSQSRTYPVDVEKSGGGSLDRIVQVSAGKEHTCALSIVGQVWCWGRYEEGQLTQTASSTRATLATSLRDITQISAGENHTCGLNTAGNVQCWGAGARGRLGHNSETGGATPVSVVDVGGANTLGSIVQVSSGKKHTCALASNGQVTCWGEGADGRLGNNASVNSLSPVLVLGEGVGGASPLTGIVQISSGLEHTCALHVSGDIKCWGKGSDGRLGHGGNENKNFSIGVLATSEESSPFFNIGSYLRGYACSGSTCGVDNISLSLTSPVSSPGTSSSVTVTVSGYSSGDRVSLYPDASCARTALGSVTTGTSGTVSMASLSEGSHRFYFQVTSSGVNSACSISFLSYERDITPPSPPSIVMEGGVSDGFSPTPFVSVLGEGDRVRVYKGDRTCGSANKVGEGRLQGGRAVVKVAQLASLGVYQFYATAVDEVGNESSCSSPPTTYRLRELNSGILLLKKISSGSRHSCVVTESGGVKCWGQGGRGRLGNGADDDSNNQVDVLGIAGTGTLGDIVQISSGGKHACALNTSGQVMCWGEGSHGRLGHDGTSDSNFPVTVVGTTGSGILSNIVQISSGREHTCGVASNGQVMCWGRGDDGRLGNNSASHSSRPVIVVGTSGNGVLGSIVQVSSGLRHTCALGSDKRVLCWGEGGDGMLGDNQTGDRNYPGLVSDAQGSTNPLENIVQINSGDSHVCALVINSEVKCWGSGASGKLGHRATANKNYPVSVVKGERGSDVLTDIIEISLGESHSCALSVNGQVKCWGEGQYGRLGHNSEDDKSYPVSVMLGSNPLDDIVEVSSGGVHTCALSAKNQVVCWGAGGQGQLGNDGLQNHFSPDVVVAGDGVLESLSVGTFQRSYTCSTGSCALGDIALTLGSVSVDAQSGTGTLAISVSGISTGETVSLYSDLGCETQVGSSASSGSSSVSASNLAEGSHKFYFKLSSSGGTTSDCSRSFLSYVLDNTSPDVPSGLSIVGESSSFIVAPTVAISHATQGDIVYFYKDSACSLSHKVGEGRIGGSSTGFELDKLTALGSYQFYAKALDDGGNESSCSTSFASYTLEDFVAPLEKLALGREHGCALTSEGGVKCWGKGDHGRLGNDASDPQDYPVSVVDGDGSTSSLTGVVQITSGDAHTCALTSQGEVKCWGTADLNKLGDGSTSGHRDHPVSVVEGDSNLGGIVQISAGYDHTCALTGGGEVKCWGQEVNSKLGNAPSLTGMVQVSAGYRHTCAVTEEAKVKCWGYRANGRLGNRSTSDGETLYPVLVQDETGVLKGVVQVSAGTNHSCALLNDFRIKCWGYNYQGQLGVHNRAPIERDHAGAIGQNPESFGKAISIKAGRALTCALLVDGQVKCWGFNSDKGTELGRSTPYPHDHNPGFVVSEDGTGSLSGVVQIALGNLTRSIYNNYGYGCALNSIGGLRCWGAGASGQLLNGATRRRRFTPVVALGSASTRFNIGAWQGEYRCSPSGCAVSDIGLALQSPTTSPSSVVAPRIVVSGISSGETITLYKERTCSTSWGTATSGAASVLVNPDLDVEGRYDFYFKSSVSGSPACSKSFLPYLFDMTPPATPSISVTTEDGADDTPTVQITSIVRGDAIRVYVDDATCSNSGSLVGESGAAGAGGNSIDIDVTSLSTPGTYHFYAIAEDLAGNLSTCSASSGDYVYSVSLW